VLSDVLAAHFSSSGFVFFFLSIRCTGDWFTGESMTETDDVQMIDLCDSGSDEEKQ